jgi:hypothetical protein
MSEESPVTQGQCDERVNKLYDQLHSVDKAVAKILGGVAVASFVVTLFIVGLLYHFNYRFSAVEKSIEGIAKTIEKIHEV